MTALEQTVLRWLHDKGEIADSDLRTNLRQRGEKLSDRKFHALIVRLEDTNLVRKYYVEQKVQGTMVRERRYQLTSTGQNFLLTGIIR